MSPSSRDSTTMGQGIRSVVRDSTTRISSSLSTLNSRKNNSRWSQDRTNSDDLRITSSSHNIMSDIGSKVVNSSRCSLVVDPKMTCTLRASRFIRNRSISGLTMTASHISLNMCLRRLLKRFCPRRCRLNRLNLTTRRPSNLCRRAQLLFSLPYPLISSSGPRTTTASTFDRSAIELFVTRTSLSLIYSNHPHTSS
jgi:hypothetical protein